MWAGHLRLWGTSCDGFLLALGFTLEGTDLLGVITTIDCSFMESSQIVDCCGCTISLWCTVVNAFSRVRSESNCNSSDKLESIIPTTILSLINWSWSAPNSVFSQGM